MVQIMRSNPPAVTTLPASFFITRLIPEMSLKVNEPVFDFNAIRNGVITARIDFCKVLVSRDVGRYVIFCKDTNL